jgi:xanthine dehydrogenase YagR molybdenum-binding subunit
MLGVYAAGRILNAKTARSQLLGGMVMGIGMALGEESIVDPRYGHFVNADLAEYHIPVHADIPESFDAIFIDEKDDKVNPLGSKGLGELGIVGAAAAVANAVHHATGQRVRDLPITLDKVLAGLN